MGGRDEPEKLSENISRKAVGGVIVNRQQY